MFILKLENGAMKKEFNIITAAKKCDLEAMKQALLEDPASVNVQEDMNGVTALHICAGNGYLSGIELLLAAPGVDPLIMDYQERTAMRLAWLIGRDDIEKAIAKVAFARLDQKRSFEPDELDDGAGEGNVVRIGPRPQLP